MKYNPDQECERLIENIKVMCKLKTMSYYAVAVKAEISNSTMHSLMHGKTKPYMHTLFKLCNALDVSVEDLLGMLFIEEDQQTSSKEIKSDEAELVMRYRCLSQEKQAMLRVYAEMLRQYAAVGNEE